MKKKNYLLAYLKRVVFGFRKLEIKNIWKLISNFKFQISNFFLHPKKTYKALLVRLSETVSRFTFHVSRFVRWSFATLPRRIVSTILIIFFILTPIFNILFAPKASAAWWNDSWLYRKAITVTNNTTTQTNVYIALTLDTSDTAKFQATCGDLRFTDSTGNLQNYFIVSGCGTVSTSVHVNLQTFPAGVQTIFAYYGNPMAPNGASSSDFATQASNYTLGSIASEEKSPGPVAYWKFDEGTGTTAQDATVQNRDGTLTNMASPATPTSGWQMEEMCVAGKCLAFDGTDDFVNQPTSIPSVQSLSFWVRPATTTQSILQLSSSVSVSASNGTITATGFASPTIYVNGKVGNTITANTWSHIEITSNTAFTADAIKFGVIGSTYFNGKIDEPKLFPYLRTKAQVQQDYNAGAANAGANSGTAASFGDSSDKWLSDGLVGYWKMDENSWNGTAGEVKDASGNGNDGVAVNGATTNAGKFGGAGVFDGSNDNVSLGNPSSLGAIAYPYTVSFWAKPTTLSQNGIVASFSLNGTAGAAYGIYNSGNKILVGNASYLYGLSGISNYLTANQWAMWTMVWTDATHLVFYLNGLPVTLSSVGDQYTVAGNFIGSRANSPNFPYYFNGSIDETRIYNRALSPAEIRKLYSFNPFVCGTSTIRDYANNLTYGTVVGEDGRCWLDRNLGATQVATASTDTNSYGWYYQWGRGTDGHQIPTSVNTSSVSSSDNPGHSNYIIGSEFWRNPVNNNLWQGVSGVNNPCPAGFRLPTLVEWNKVILYSATRNSATAFASALKLTTNGYRGSTLGIYYFYGSYGQYWMGNLSGNSPYYKGFSSTGLDPSTTCGGTGCGRAVRCIKDDPTTPVAYYKFDEGNGTTANNSGSGGSTLNGTLTNMANPATATSGWTDAGKFGKGLNFDGSNDYVNTPSVAYNQDSTFEVWFNSSSSTNQAGIIGNDANSLASWGGNLCGGMYILNGTLYASVYSGSAYQIVSQAVSTSQWYHAVFVRDVTNQKMYLYINGKLVGNQSFTAASLGIVSSINYCDNNNFKIGRYSSNNSVGPNGYFQGSMDEVKIYTYALSPDDVKIEYNHGSAAVMGASGSAVSSGSSTSARAEYCPPGNVEGNCASGQNPSPIADWEMDEGTGTIAKDTSGNNNNGTLTNGPTWAQGKIGKGINFDGSNDYVNTSLASPITTGTLGLWINPTTLTSGNWRGYIFDSANLFVRDEGTGQLTFANHSLSGYTSYTIPAINRWYYLTFTWTPSTLSAYVNGSFVSSSNMANNGLTSFLKLGVGDVGAFNGKMDQMHLYNYARTPAQIAWDYNRGGPVGWWKMDECQGSTIHDSSGNANDGTLTVGASGTQTSAGTCTTASTAWGNGTTGKFNSSLNFDGTDDRVAISNFQFPISNQFSISQWLNVQTLATNKAIIGKWGSSQNNILLKSDDTNSNQLKICLASSLTDNCTNYATTTDANLVAANWQNVQLVYDGSQASNALKLKLFLNGVQKTLTFSGTIPATLATSTASLEIGGNASLGTYFSGRIDEVRIYNYALTKEQIFNVMNGGASLAFGNNGPCGGINNVKGSGSDTNTYGTVVGKDGRCWLDRNLGATQVATAYNDSAAYGWYYQWGRGTDGHQISTSGTTSTLSSSDTPGNANFVLTSVAPYDWRSSQNDNLWQGVAGINNPCPAGFRLPTSTEWVTLINALGLASCSASCGNSLFNSTLKITSTGVRVSASPYDGSRFNVGGRGDYWSSSISGTSISYLYFYPTAVKPTYTVYRASGSVVRCIKD